MPQMSYGGFITDPHGDVMRLFTVAHARRTLPLVRRVVRDVVDAYQQFANQPNTPADDAEHRRQLTRLDNLLAELADVGCSLKDWRIGLVDFPSLYEGRQVELCWRFGEDGLTYWHEVGLGYAGRQRITPEFEKKVEHAVQEAAVLSFSETLPETDSSEGGHDSEQYTTR